jgi:hypothetical protein
LVLQVKQLDKAVLLHVEQAILHAVQVPLLLKYPMLHVVQLVVTPDPVHMEQPVVQATQVALVPLL